MKVHYLVTATPAETSVIHGSSAIQRNGNAAETQENLADVIEQIQVYRTKPTDCAAGNELSSDAAETRISSQLIPRQFQQLLI
jgi:hypothetical protein